MHDAIQMERLGVPSTLVITDAFIGLAASFAASLGSPGYHTVTVRHPIASLSEPDLRRVAEKAVDLAIQQLTGQ